MEVINGVEARTKLIAGIEKLYNAVRVTLGPKGKSVIIETATGIPISTKDGVTVAKYITLSDTIENIGAKLIKQATIKTASSVGDGTTTATILTRNLIIELMELLNSGVSIIDIRNTINALTASVIKKLKAETTKATSDIIEKVALVSANGDKEVASVISLAQDEVGENGFVAVSDSVASKTSFETTAGFVFDEGFVSPYFINNPTRGDVRLDNPYILLYDGKISNTKEMVPILEKVVQQNRSLLIVCDSIEGDALATLIMSKMKGNFSCCAVKTPKLMFSANTIIEDLALIVGAKVMNNQAGIKLQSVTLNDLGQCKKLIVTDKKTTIIDGKGDKGLLESKIDALRRDMDGISDDTARLNLQKRIARLNGKISTITSGAATEIEAKERRDRIEDAVYAVRAAMDGGVSVGGGVTLLRSSQNLGSEDMTQNENKVCSAFANCLVSPLRQILENACVDSTELTLEILNADDDFGFNSSTEKVENLRKSGIFDPTDVVISTLSSSVSIALTVISTEAVIPYDTGVQK